LAAESIVKQGIEKAFYVASRLLLFLSEITGLYCVNKYKMWENRQRDLIELR
jgi:hypothetical protein